MNVYSAGGDWLKAQDSLFPALRLSPGSASLLELMEQVLGTPP